MKRFLLALCIMFLSWPLWAQDKPCTHETGDVHPGIAELKCRINVDQKRIHDLEDELLAFQAAAAMISNDLAAVKVRDQALAKWFEEWFGKKK